MQIPSGIWAVASDLSSAEQAQQWCRSAALAAAFSVRRSVGTDPEVLAQMRILAQGERWLASHGRADLAFLAGAQAVIAGVRSLSGATYKQKFPQLCVGVSTHTLEEAQAAIDADAHFLFFGPVWDTPEKSGILMPRGLHRLAQVVALGVPVIAIGGIGRTTQVQQVRATGAHGAAVLRAARNAHLMQELVDAWG